MAEPFSMAPNFSWVDEGDPVQAAAEAAAMRQRQAAMPMGGRKEGKTTAVLDSLGTSIYNTLAKPSRIWGALGEVPMGQPLSERPDIVDAVAQTATDLVGAPALMPGGIVKGAAGIFGGKLAQTADANALKRAEEMAGSGASRESVWNETGWFQGRDGKWRFEIPDDKSVFNADKMASKEYRIFGNTVTGREGKAGDVLSHPQFFDAYPDAAPMPIGQTRYGGGNRGTYHPPGMIGEQIGLDESLLTGPTRQVLPDGPRGVMLHELQHRTQQAEGFARGGDPKTIGTVFNPDLERYRDALKNDKELKRYLEVHGSPQYRSEIDDQNRIWVKEYQPRLDEIYARGKDYQPHAADQVFADFNKLKAGKYPLDEETERLFKSLRERDIPMREPSATLSGSDLYSRLAGEVEARNVQHRMNLTPEERRASPPWKTEDTPPTKQVVFDRDGPVVEPADVPMSMAPNSSFTLGANATDKKTGAAVVGADLARDTAPMSMAPGIRAYHGSPHDFDRFDLSKIGTGEGAQSYGHGLYFAENEGVARSYKNDPRMLATRHGADWDAVQHNAGARVYDAKGDADEAIYQLRDRIRNSVAYGDSPTSLKELRDSLDLLKSGWRPPTGKMYEVNINAKPEQFLDFDKGIHNQSSDVRDAVRKLPNYERAGKPYLEDSNYPLGSAYKQGLLPGSFSPEGGSAALRDAGIPGIKYADQGSRMTGDAPKIIEKYGSVEKALEVAQDRLSKAHYSDRPYWEKTVSELQRNQTNNYVLFDDKLVNILRKYALPGAVGGAAVPGSFAPDRGD